MTSATSTTTTTNTELHDSKQDSSTWVMDPDWEEYTPEKGSFVHHMIAGSAAGIAEHVGMFPLDTWRTFTQVHRGKSPSITFAKLLKQYGFWRLWRGAPVMITACVPSHAAYFSVYEVAKRELGVNQPGHHPLSAGLAGALATIMHDAIITPMDVIKQRLQLGYYSGLLGCMKDIYTSEGIPAFFRSYPTTLLMNIPYASVVVATNESMKQVLQPHGIQDMHSYLISGAVAGAVAAIATNPLDVLKTRLQTQRCCAPAFNADTPPLDGACKADQSTECPVTSEAAKQGGHGSYSQPAAATAKASGDGMHGSNTMRHSGAPTVKPSGGGKASIYTTTRLLEKAAPQYLGLVDTTKKLIAEDGYRGFMKGVNARILTHTPSMAISWGTYEFIKHFLAEHFPASQDSDHASLSMGRMNQRLCPNGVAPTLFGVLMLKFVPPPVQDSYYKEHEHDCSPYNSCNNCS
eukprot:gb/GECG01001500.1/.p1 GENE.gb/GECG01001500.1/~~gb/GECG01001500.1/.p1  ORF type:complete len:462 (+),score=38.44 gb/GECG01001500.1/:1-1386(+)